MPTKDIRTDKETRTRSLTLIPTKSCNLRCSYCYEKDSKGDGRLMDIEVAKNVINHYMSTEDEFEMVLIDFFGGEPLLAFSFVKEVCEWVKSRDWKKDYHFSIGTNGTLLTDEIKCWLLENKKHITPAISINGNKLAHDLTRDNSYDKLSPHIPFFMENWPSQPAKMTICAENIPYVAESVIEFEEMGLFFTANVAGEDFWGSDGEDKSLLEQYNEQLMQLVDYYSLHPELVPVYRILDSLPPFLGIPPANDKSNRGDCTRFCGAGHEMVTVDVDGKEYPCHRFLPWVTGKAAPKGPVNTQNRWNPARCSNCKIVNICPTCAGFNWEANNDTGIRTTFHCEATKLEVIASAKLILNRIYNKQIPKIQSLPIYEKKTLQRYIDVLLELIEDGI